MRQGNRGMAFEKLINLSNEWNSVYGIDFYNFSQKYIFDFFCIILQHIL
jgi:penicillin-binding protein-related factor A (putative recombinase)